MKALITDVKYLKELHTAFGTLYQYEVSYNDTKSFYNTKNDKQDKFVAGQEAEFTEEVKNFGGVEQVNIRPNRSRNDSTNTDAINNILSIVTDIQADVKEIKTTNKLAF